jgi:TrmH family RNA methyltransferase
VTIDFDLAPSPPDPDVVGRFRRAREDGTLAVLEGFHAVKHALRFGAEILDVVVEGDASRLEALAGALAPDVLDELRARAQPVDAETFAALVSPRPPTGVAALARRPPGRMVEVLAGPGPGPIVLLDRPRQLGNVGAAIRVAAAAGAEAVAVTGTADPWHPAAIRGAAGLQFALPVGRIGDTAGVARPVVAIDPGGEPLTPGAVPPGAVLAFGSERHGLSEAWRERAEVDLALPMRPGVSSLNLAAAVAASLYVLAARG